MASLGVGDTPMCTYGAYYDDEANDALGGNYTGGMEEDTIEGAAVMSADEVHAIANSCATQRISTAFLILGIRPVSTPHASLPIADGDPE